MSRLTAVQRSMSARAAAHARWARMTDAERDRFRADARARLLDRWERQVDPDGVMDPAERARRAASVRKEHMTRMALASSRKRQKA